MKVVINICFGGFSVSEAVFEKLIEYGMTVGGEKEAGDFEIRSWDKGITSMGKYYFSGIRTYDSEFRANPLLIKAIEDVGIEKAGGSFSKLSIVEVPDDVVFEINEYDGNEHIAEVHRTWR